MSEYNKGYKDGFADGWQKALEVSGKRTGPAPDISRIPVGPGLVEPQIKCDKCGVEWKGIMGYVCPRQDCSIQPKIISGFGFAARTTVDVATDREWQRDHERSKY